MLEVLGVGLRYFNRREKTLKRCVSLSGKPFAKENFVFFALQNTVMSPNFLAWKFCGKEQFPHSFGQFARNYAETVPFHIDEITVFFAVFFTVFPPHCSKIIIKCSW